VPDRHSPEWIAHRAARVRCSDPRSAKWPAYGARGIRVCDAWIGPGGFARFFAHIGPRPTSRHSLDRVDNDRGYEPGNVRWAAIAQQQSNRRDNRRIEHGGETMTLSEWARRAGIKPNTLFRRLQHGWTMERALQAPSPALANRRRGVSP
jgi:hypothetical protein